LLIEESRTNLTVKSDDFGAGEWNQAAQRNLTVTANNTASPSGATDADLLTVGATTTTYQVVQALPATGNITSGTAYTVSCFFKAKEVTRVNIHAGNQVTFPADAIFDLTGVGSIIGTPTGTASIQQYPNGWYRCIITATAGATSNTSFRISPVSGTSRNYPGNSVDSFWAWGAQLEAGSFATSYIPTTTASVVRSADLCDITGGDFNNFYNQSEGTVVAVASEFRRGTAYVSIVRFAISSDASGNRFQIGTNGNKTGDSSPIEFIGVKAGVIQYQSFATSPTPESRAALAYKTDDIRGALNGTLSAADSPPSEIFAGANSMSIGTLGIHIASIRYYKKRLPDAKLQALTV
jgi:hypothetical protein